jgi:hypothetical protein
VFSQHTKVVALGTTGLLFGSGVFVATPALAVDTGGCNAENTFRFIHPGGLDLTGLQTELDTGIKPLVCVTGNFDLDATLSINRSVTLRGTGSPKPVFTGTEEDGVLVDIAVAKDVILENLEFRGNDLQEQTGVVVGVPFAGVYSAGTLTIRDSTFSDFGAGGISSEVDLFIEDSQFVDNSVEGNPIDSDEVGGGAVFGAQDVTIADSDFTGNEAYGEIAAAGGAVAGSTVIITGGSFDANEAVADTSAEDVVGLALGGAVFGKVVHIEGALFTNNFALSSAGVDGYGGSLGGAVFGSEEMRSEGNDFRENQAGVLGTTLAYSVGGAVSGGDSIIIENSSFEENLAYSTSVPGVAEADAVPEVALALGGAVSSVFGYGGVPEGSVIPVTVTIEGSNFEGNVVTADGGAGPADDIPGLAAGGAVLSYQGLVIGTSVFQENSAAGNGITDEEGLSGGSVGGASASYATTTVTASTFEGNSARDGGAVIAKGTDVGNSTFVNNVATNEGGAILSAGGGDVSFSTFLDNEAAEPDDGGDIPGDAIYIAGKGTDDFGVAASIFAGSSGHPQLGVGVEGGDPPTFVDYGANIFSTAAEPDLTTTGDTDLNASVFGKTVVSVFGWNPTLEDNGGPTHTLALRAGALAINFVVGGDPGGIFPEDQRGVARDGRFDAGAFELASAGRSSATSVPELARTGPSALGLMGLASGLLVALGGAVIALRGRLTRRL